eukprot:GHVH01001700.1.p1 GENE.GHVH01001700.1~~GHVH01001700.1.p1  ORF type:complete len:108 (+),score=20.17 GHVH01001700.1:51-374(+)
MAKQKKSATDGIGHQLGLVMKSGSVKLGFRETIRAVRDGNAKLVLLSNNCPALRCSELEYLAMLSKIGVHRFVGSNTELGTAVGRMHRVSCIAITDLGNSDIVKTIQ